jgi:hypothetical protein
VSVVSVLGGTLVFARRRQSAGALFVFVAPDDASMQKLEDRFVALPDFHEGVQY